MFHKGSHILLFPGLCPNPRVVSTDPVGRRTVLHFISTSWLRLTVWVKVPLSLSSKPSASDFPCFLCYFCLGHP